MKLLKCKFCGGEVDIIDNTHAINKKIKCTKCGLSNTDTPKEPEVVIIRRRVTYST